MPVCYAMVPHMHAAMIQKQHSFSTCSVPQESQLADHMIDSIHTGHTAASLALHLTAKSNACLLCKTFCCLMCLLQCSQLQHMLCDSLITACTAYERKLLHTGHTAASLALQYTAVSNARLLCKNSAASYACCNDSGTAQLQHMQCDSGITACIA